MPKEADFRLTDHGIAIRLVPQTREGRTWLMKNVARDGHPTYPLLFLALEDVPKMLRQIQATSRLTVDCGKPHCRVHEHLRPTEPETPAPVSGRAALRIRELASQEPSPTFEVASPGGVGAAMEMSLRLGVIAGLATTLLEALDSEAEARTEKAR